jgi:hypothetical protein
MPSSPSQRPTAGSSAFNQPVDYFLDYRDSTLTLHFTLPFRTPFKARELQLEIYDPEYFIDFQFQEKEPVKLVGAPATCKVAIVRADNGAANAQAQSSARRTLHPADNSNFGAMFANKATVTLMPMIWRHLTVAQRAAIVIVAAPCRTDGGRRPAARSAGAGAVRRAAQGAAAEPARRRDRLGARTSSPNSIARCPPPFAPQRTTAARSGRCSASPSPTAFSMPPDPATARR